MHVYQQLTCQRLLAWLLGFDTCLIAVGSYPVADSLITDNLTCPSPSKLTYQSIISQPINQLLDSWALFCFMVCGVAVFGLVSFCLRDYH